MKQTTNGAVGRPFEHRRLLPLCVAVINFLLLGAAVLFYGRYLSLYQIRLREENLGNIANLNQSSAFTATAVIEGWDTKLKDAVMFLRTRNGSVDEALEVIEQSNSSEDCHFELIGPDYNGFTVRRDESGAFIPVSYSQSTYASLWKALDDTADNAYKDICFAPEFTDGDTAYKTFAVYRHLPIKDSTGETQTYTLLLATKSKTVLEGFNQQSGFEEQSTVLIKDNGDYIVSSSDFKSDNFFHYIYLYNDLTLDERNELEQQVRQNDTGELYYKNAKGQDSVFRYEHMSTNDWYCITSVPISSFRTPVGSSNYIIYAVIALVLMLGTDIGWLTSMNRRLRLSAQREKDASEAKTEFLSRMSHDIRTPLNGIIGLTTLAMDEECPPQLREYLDNIKVSGQFLTGLVNDILDLSKVESGKVELQPEPYTMKELGQYVQAVVAPLCAEKGLDFRVQPLTGNSAVLLDRLRFNQVVFNLLSNAVKYTPKGGFVELGWNLKDLPEERVELNVTVRDNGEGMSEEFQRHMFESFTQEHQQTANTGTGLGLAIVSSLLKLMKGSIEVDSKQNIGSSFSVRIPTKRCQTKADDHKKQHSVQLEGRRVLLCEDNSINIMVAQRMLQAWKMVVDTAENGLIAVQKFKDSPPGTYELILMDVMMPQLNGMDATKLIRELDREDAATVPIIAMTANAYDTDVKNCLQAGMNAHMGKPINRERLYELLSNYL